MSRKTGCFVIAVAGPSGAGKSTLVRALVQELEDAVALFFDDYHPSIVSSTRYPEDMGQWLAEGADPTRWATPQMLTDLQALMRGEPILHPKQKCVLQPATFIVLDEPFGNARTGLKDLINYIIVVKTPLEVALTRRLLREAEKPYSQEHPDEFRTSLLTYLHLYLDIARPLYLAVNEQVCNDCHLLLDGLTPISELVHEATKQVRMAAALLLSNSG